MRASLSLISVLLVVVATASEPPAEAHVGKRQGLTFQDRRPLKLTVKEATDGLDVTFCNLDADKATRVVDGITGFRFKSGDEPVEDGAVWLDPGAPPKVGSGRCRRLHVQARARDGDEKLKPGDYTGVLVVTSGGAGGARRRVVLTVPGGKDPAVSANPSRILPKTIKDFSVGGVNFFPSVLNPLAAFGFSLGVLVALLLIPFSLNRFRPKWLTKNRLFGAYAVALILAIVGGLSSFGKNNDSYFEGSGPGAVDMSSPRVATDATRGAVGSLVGKDGTVAMAVVRKDGQLDTEGIPRAGSYDGKIDLLRGADGGEATMTANIRDYWPFALLVIAAGVLVGAGVTRYFTVKRGKALVKLKVAQLEDEITKASDEFNARDSALYAKYAVQRRLDERLSEIERLLDTDEPDDIKQAAEELKTAESYFQTVREMWTHLEPLPQAAAHVASLVTTLDLGVDGERVPAVSRARELMGRKFDDGHPDEESSDLTARKKEIDETAALLDELTRSLPAAAKLRNEAEEIDPMGWDDEDEKALETHREALWKAVGELVAAGSAEDAGKSMSAVVAECVSIDGLVKRADQAKHRSLSQRLSEAMDVMVPAEAGPLQPSALTVDLPRDDEGAPPPPTQTTAAQLRRRFAITDRQMTLASGILAVFSGLLTLYLTSSTWGAPGDYLKAFLWGSVVSEGVKYAAALAARTGLPTS